MYEDRESKEDDLHNCILLSEVIMEAGRYIEVFNPYDWLPEYGETGVDLLWDDGELTISIMYDGPKGESVKKLWFKSVSEVKESAFPGPAIPIGMTYSFQCDVPMGSLVEYPDSEGAAAWTKHFQAIPPIKHYRIIFLSVKKIVVVYAKSCVVMN